MSSVVVIEAAAEVLSLEAAKAHLRVDHDEDDALIADLCRAAEQHLAGPDGWVGRSIGRQTLELRIDHQPSCWRWRLPYGPTSDILEAATLDRDGNLTVLVPSVAYQLVDGGSVVAAFAPVAGSVWPGFAAGLRIRYVAGYEAGQEPAPLRRAMLLLVGHWYENREAVNVGNIVTTMPLAVEALCAPFRIWR